MTDLALGQQKTFLERFYQGDIALWKMYWLFGLAMSIPILTLEAVLVGTMEIKMETATSLDQLMPYITMLNIFMAVLLCWYILLFIGTWRSAQKYRDAHSRDKWYQSPWGGITQGVLIIGALRFAGNLATYIKGLSAVYS